MCQSTLQFWHQSLCRQINITAVCNKEGDWEPTLDDTCVELSGMCSYHHFLVYRSDVEANSRDVLDYMH